MTLTDKMLGHYSLTRETGHGAMSAVYEGVDARLGRTVAVKVLKTPPFMSPEKRDEMVQRMRREARAVGRLSHPNVVTIFDVGEQDGLHYIVMEYLDGVTLRQRMNAGPLSSDEAAGILDQVAAGLDAVHTHGVVHRDLKPSNVMLLPDGRVKLMDFGVARSGDETAMTQMGTMVGSPSYMSPEQVRGESATPASDIWSLGVLLHEMLTGKPAFTGDSLPAVLYKIVHDEPAPLTPSFSPEVAAALRQALEKDPANRFPSASAFAGAFRSALRTEPAAAIPVAAAAPIAATAVAYVTPAAVAAPIPAVAAAALSIEMPSENDTITVPPPPTFTRAASLPPPPAEPPLPPRSPRPASATVAPARRRRLLTGPVAAMLALLTIGGGGAALMLFRDKAQETDRLITSTRDSTAAPPAAAAAAVAAAKPKPTLSAGKPVTPSDVDDVWEKAVSSSEPPAAPPRSERSRAVSAALSAKKAQAQRAAAAAAEKRKAATARQASAEARPSEMVPAPPHREPAVVMAQEMAKESRPAPERETEPTPPPAVKEEEVAEPESPPTANVEAAPRPGGVEAAPEEKQPAAAPLSESREEPTRNAVSELRGLLNEWIEATNAGDIDGQMRFYSPMMAAYYRERGVSRAAVRSEKRRVFAGAERIAITAGTPKITLSDDGRSATMRFRKEYVIQGGRGARRGAVLQELRWRRVGDADWRIVSERDLRVLG